MAQVTFESVEAAVHPDEFQGSSEEGYNNGAMWAAKCVLNAAKRQPLEFGLALDEYRLNPYTTAVDKLLLPEQKATLDEYGLTGFQWGWAVGTVAWLLEQAPVPNGAVLTVRVN